jgi:hypothetical protein
MALGAQPQYWTLSIIGKFDCATGLCLLEIEMCAKIQK